MDQPVCLASPWKSKETPSMGRESVFPETKVSTTYRSNSFCIAGARHGRHRTYTNRRL